MVGIPSHFWRLRHRHGAPTFCDLGKLNVVTKVEIDHDGRPTVKNCHTTQFFPHFFPKKIGDVIAMDPWWSLAARSRPAKSFSQPTEKHDLNQRPTTPEVGPSKFGRNMPKSRQWQSNLPIENCSTYHFQFFFGKNVGLLLSGKTARMRNGLQSFFKPRGPRMYTHGFHVQMFAAVTLSSRFVRVSSLCRGMQLLRTPPWGFKRSFKCPTFGFPVASQSSKLAVIVAATTLSEKKTCSCTHGGCMLEILLQRSAALVLFPRTAVEHTNFAPGKHHIVDPILNSVQEFQNQICIAFASQKSPRSKQIVCSVFTRSTIPSTVCGTAEGEPEDEAAGSTSMSWSLVSLSDSSAFPLSMLSARPIGLPRWRTNRMYSTDPIVHEATKFARSRVVKWIHCWLKKYSKIIPQIATVFHYVAMEPKGVVTSHADFIAHLHDFISEFSFVAVSKTFCKLNPLVQVVDALFQLTWKLIFCGSLIPTVFQVFLQFLPRTKNHCCKYQPKQSHESK